MPNKPIDRFLLVIIAFLSMTSFMSAQDEKESLISIGNSSEEKAANNDAIISALNTFVMVYTHEGIDVLRKSGLSDDVNNGKKLNFIDYEQCYKTSMTQNFTKNVVILNVSIQIDRLKEYFQNKGISVDFRTNGLLGSVKHQALEEQAEVNAIAKLTGILHETLQRSYNFTIMNGVPKSLNSQSTKWQVPLEIYAKANFYLSQCYYLCVNLLQKISVLQYDKATVVSTNNLNPVFIGLDENTKTFYLRKQLSIMLFKSLENLWCNFTRFFVIRNGVKDITGYGKNWNDNWTVFKKYGYDNIPELRFFSPNKDVARYKYDDERSMAELDKIQQYKVEQEPLVFRYEEGGIKIDEKNIILAPILKNQIGAAENGKIYFNGRDDWRSPTDDEMTQISDYIWKWKQLWGAKYVFRRSDKTYLFDYSDVLVRNAEINSHIPNTKQIERTLLIKSIPVNARLFMDNVYIGMTPYKVRYVTNEREHVFSLEKDGKTGGRKIVNPETLKDSVITLDMNTPLVIYLTQDGSEKTISLKVEGDPRNRQNLKIFIAKLGVNEGFVKNLSWKELYIDDLVSSKSFVELYVTDRSTNQKYKLRLAGVGNVIKTACLYFLNSKSEEDKPLKMWSFTHAQNID